MKAYSKYWVATVIRGFGTNLHPRELLARPPKPREQFERP